MLCCWGSSCDSTAAAVQLLCGFRGPSFLMLINQALLPSQAQTTRQMPIPFETKTLPSPEV